MRHAATVNVSFPKHLLKDIDAVAQDESRTRSELLREATRLYIERKKRWGKIFSFWRAEAARTKFTPSDMEDSIRRARSSRK